VSEYLANGEDQPGFTQEQGVRLSIVTNVTVDVDWMKKKKKKKKKNKKDFFVFMNYKNI